MIDERISVKRWSSPTMALAMCGATSPTNPMVPTNATAAAVIAEMSTKVRTRTEATLTPRACARSSPRRSAVSAQASRMSRGRQVDSTTATNRGAATLPGSYCRTARRQSAAAVPGGEELHQRLERLEKEQNGDAGQYHRFRAQVADESNGVDAGTGEQGAGECRQRNGHATGQKRSGAGDDGRRGAEAGGRRHPRV